MTTAAVDAVRTERDRAIELFESLTPEEWAAPSGCEGWSVQDVACHMASVFHSIADPSSIEQGTSDDVEANAEVPVQARRNWTPEQVIDEYRTWSEAGLAAFAAMQDPPLADTVVPLGNLGSHPLHILANAIAFDHYCHLRHDIGHAVERAAALPRDGDVLAPGLEWMLVGIPQMCADALAGSPSQTVNLVLDGPGGCTAVLAPGEGRWTVDIGSTDPDAPTLVSDGHAFVAWATKRTAWRDHAEITGAAGDVAAAASVIDAVNVI
jgi:uncharacterized protein (TIGR03083 family)